MATGLENPWTLGIILVFLGALALFFSKAGVTGQSGNSSSSNRSRNNSRSSSSEERSSSNGATGRSADSSSNGQTRNNTRDNNTSGGTSNTGRSSTRNVTAEIPNELQNQLDEISTKLDREPEVNVQRAQTDLTEIRESIEGLREAIEAQSYEGADTSAIEDMLSQILSDISNISSSDENLSEKIQDLERVISDELVPAINSMAAQIQQEPPTDDQEAREEYSQLVQNLDSIMRDLNQHGAGGSSSLAEAIGNLKEAILSRLPGSGNGFINQQGESGNMSGTINSIAKKIGVDLKDEINHLSREKQALEEFKEMDEKEIANLEDAVQALATAENAIEDAEKHREHLVKLENTSDQRDRDSVTQAMETDLNDIEDDLQEAEQALANFDKSIEQLKREVKHQKDLERKAENIEGHVEDTMDELENYIGTWENHVSPNRVS